MSPLRRRMIEDMQILLFEEGHQHPPAAAHFPLWHEDRVVSRNARS